MNAFDFAVDLVAPTASILHAEENKKRVRSTQMHIMIQKLQRAEKHLHVIRIEAFACHK
jgi:hypothetical protein